MKLIIKDIAQEDYGEYKCYAENLQGSGENSVVLSGKTYTTMYVSDTSYQVFSSLIFNWNPLFYGNHMRKKNNKILAI